MELHTSERTPAAAPAKRPKPPRPAKPMHYEALTKRLAAATARHGTIDHRIPLTALATANALLGSDQALHAPMMRHLADPDAAIASTRALWAAQVDHFTYLRGPLNALIDWTEAPADHQRKALAACYAALVDVDLLKTFSDVHGDLLGPVYTALRSKSSRQASGSFYTPVALAELLGNLVTPRPGTRFLEPACGSGGMILGALRAMRSAGDDPDTVAWVLNDIDALAVALAGVNLAAHGLHNVTLCVGDGLLLGTGHPGDPLLKAPRH